MKHVHMAHGNYLHILVYSDWTVALREVQMIRSNINTLNITGILSILKISCANNV